MLWIFQVLALSAGLYGCQVWATNTLTFKSSATTKDHICFSPRLLSKDAVGCETKHKYALPTERDRSAAPVLLLISLWCSLLECLLTTDNALLSKINKADLLARRKASWTFEVLYAVHKIPGADVHISATMSSSKINMIDFELFLREQNIREWRDLDQIHPHDANVSSRVMRTHHTHFGVPIGSQTGWWDDQKRATKPTRTSYL